MLKNINSPFYLNFRKKEKIPHKAYKKQQRIQPFPLYITSISLHIPIAKVSIQYIFVIFSVPNAAILLFFSNFCARLLKMSIKINIVVYLSESELNKFWQKSLLWSWGAVEFFAAAAQLSVTFLLCFVTFALWVPLGGGGMVSCT